MASLSSTPPKMDAPEMSTPQHAHTALEPKKALDISNLMSPPEPVPFDSFQQVGNTNANRSFGSEKRGIPNAPLSPPISPFTKGSNTIDPVPPISITVKDPILYPTSEITSSPPAPLFNAPHSGPTEARRVVDEHIASRPLGLFRDATPPRREDYELALYFKSNVMRMFQENPRGWLRKERAMLRADRALQLGSRPNSKLATILPAARQAQRQPRDAHAQPIRNHANRVKKPDQAKTAPKARRVSRGTGEPASRAPGAAAKAPRAIQATHPMRNTIRVSTTPERGVRTVAPNREDKDFALLPDFCPPLDSLPERSNSLKVDWKGTPLDLSTDPHRNMLHPDELLLAASLRLDCATYLTSKRRIFMRRVECLEIGKEFRKTDAQQACKIDVNKASKLWMAYDKVGWLDPRWTRRFAKA